MVKEHFYFVVSRIPSVYVYVYLSLSLSLSLSLYIYIYIYIYIYTYTKVEYNVFLKFLITRDPSLMIQCVEDRQVCLHYYGMNTRVRETEDTLN